jgi:hypothetical protein
VLTNRRAQLDFPTMQQRLMAQGAEVPVRLWDTVGADYKSGDVLTIVALDGQTGAVHPVRYAVGLVDRLPAPLALTSVELTGYGGTQP